MQRASHESDPQEDDSSQSGSLHSAKQHWSAYNQEHMDQEIKILESKLEQMTNEYSSLIRQNVKLRRGLVGPGKTDGLLRENATTSRAISCKKSSTENRLTDIRMATNDPEEPRKRRIDVTPERTPVREHIQIFSEPVSPRLQGCALHEEDNGGESTTSNSRTSSHKNERDDEVTVNKKMKRTSLQLLNRHKNSEAGSVPSSTSADNYHPLRSPSSTRYYQGNGSDGENSMNRGNDVSEDDHRAAAEVLDESSWSDGDNLMGRHMKPLLTRQTKSYIDPSRLPPTTRSSSTSSSDSRGIRMPVFEGKPHEVIEDWIHTWQLYAASQNLTEEIIPSQLTNKLGKDVKSKLRALNDDERLNARAIQMWLRETYGGEIEQVQAKEDFYRMVQLSQETCRDFMDRLKTTWRIAHNGPEGDWKRSKRAKEAIRDQFFNGLLNQEVASTMENRSRTLPQEHLCNFLSHLSVNTDEEIVFHKSMREERQLALLQRQAMQHANDAVRTDDKHSAGDIRADEQKERAGNSAKTIRSAGKYFCRAIECDVEEFKPRIALSTDTYAVGGNAEFFSQRFASIAHKRESWTPELDNSRSYGSTDNERTLPAREPAPTRDRCGEHSSNQSERLVDKLLPSLKQMEEMVAANNRLFSHLLRAAGSTSGVHAVGPGRETRADCHEHSVPAGATQSPSRHSAQGETKILVESTIREMKSDSLCLDKVAVVASGVTQVRDNHVHGISSIPPGKGLVFHPTQVDHPRTDQPKKETVNAQQSQSKHLGGYWLPAVPKTEPWGGWGDIPFNRIDACADCSTVARNLQRIVKSDTLHKGQDWEDAQQYGEVTISLADCQWRALPGIGPESTVVSMSLWKKYRKMAENRGDAMMDYTQYRKLAKSERTKSRRIVAIEGLPVRVHGPFKCLIEIGPNPVVIEVFLTGDKSFGEKCILGQDAWGMILVKAMVVNRIACSAGGAPNLRDTHAKVSPVKALQNTMAIVVDIGAGPNVMSKETYLRLGYSLDDLKPTLFQLTTTDARDAKTLGHAYKVPITIGRATNLNLNFVVCDKLGKYDAILGREFFIKYDVALDIPRRILEVRNPKGIYQIQSHLESKEHSSKFIVSTASKVSLHGEHIECVNDECLLQTEVVHGKSRLSELFLACSGRWGAG